MQNTVKEARNRGCRCESEDYQKSTQRLLKGTRARKSRDGDAGNKPTGKITRPTNLQESFNFADEDSRRQTEVSVSKLQKLKLA